MKVFNTSNITSVKQFGAAINDVFSSIAARQEQIQQLCQIAVIEAARMVEGRNGELVHNNNLTWLSMLYNKAIDTKGLNAKRLKDYIENYLVVGVTYSEKSQSFKRKNSKQAIEYTLNVTVKWYDYGKPKDETETELFQPEKLLKRDSDKIKRELDKLNEQAKQGVSVDADYVAKLSYAREQIEALYKALAEMSINF